MANNKLQYVDAIRGLAIMAVLLVHCGQHGTNHYPAPITQAIVNGQMGVQLFFVMSAFTLFLSYVNRQGRERFAIRNFFIRRVFRIAPMYWLGIAYYLWQDGTGPNFWTGDEPGISHANIASNFFFVHGFFPHYINSMVPGGWSIAVEMAFYCLIPMLFRWVKNFGQALWLLCITLGGGFVLHVLMLWWQPISETWLWKEYLFMYLPNQLPIFAIGIMLFFLLGADEEKKRFDPRALVVLVVLFLFRMLSGTGALVGDHVLFGFGFLGLAFGLAKRPLKAIVNPVITHIGKVSFSLYLVHFAMLHWMDRFGLGDLIAPDGLAKGLANFGVRYLVVLVAGTLVSTALYHAIEMPMQQVGKRLIDRWEKPPVAA